MANTQQFKLCKFNAYGKYCTRFYFNDKKLYGWSDLTEFECIYVKKYYNQDGEEIQIKDRFCKCFKPKGIFDKIKDKFLRKKII